MTRGAARPEWAKFDVDRWRASDTWRKLSTPERVIATLLFVWQSQKGPILDEGLEISTAACGLDATEVRLVLAKAFVLRHGAWENTVAMNYYREGIALLEARRKGGQKGGLSRVRNAQAQLQGQLEGELQGQHLVVVVGSTVDSSLSSNSKQLKVKQDGSRVEKVPQKSEPEQTALTIIEPTFIAPPSSEEPAIEAQVTTPPPVAPPTREAAVAELARTFLHCRHLRLYGDEVKFNPSVGMLRQVGARMASRLADGFDPALLVTLPALVDDAAFKFMLKDPEILLRTDNAQGGKCHARKIEASLPGLDLGKRQVAIIRNIGTLDYVQNAGCSSRWW